MKHLLLTLLIATLCAAAHGQTLKSVMFNTTNATVVTTNRVIFPLLGVASGTAGTPSLTYASGTNLFGTFASSAVGIGPFLGFSVDGTRRFFISTNTIRAESPISFSAGNDSATRTNLGLPWTGLTNANADAFLTALRVLEDINSTNLLSVTAARHLYDETGQGLSLKGDEGEFVTSASFVTTNAPANSTNAVRWLILTEGTNSYRVPLYQ